jgi:thymidylate synthase ThyX
MPEAVEAAGVTDDFEEAMDRSADLHAVLERRLPEEAAYAVCLAYKVRFVLHLNAREAMHLIELRSSPQGHPAYRAIAQEMHRQIAEVAGHRAIAEMMRFVDHSAEPSLERLDAERRAAQRRRLSGANGEPPSSSTPHPSATR